MKMQNIGKLNQFKTPIIPTLRAEKLEIGFDLKKKRNSETGAPVRRNENEYA